MKPLTLLSFLFFAACTSDQLRPLTPSFYFWETTFKTSAPERVLLDSLACKKMFIKVLDVGRNAATGEIEPYARIEFSDTLALAGREIVPTVFITNEVFKGLTAEKTDWLADKIAQVLRATPGTVHSYQFDCDWTASTREAFFLFLKKIRPALPPHAQLSATIRLHQYKFPERTGVPPVDRGMLMFYNTGDIETEGEHNTIFHPDDVLKYLHGAPSQYPLPLDIALPLFSWTLVYREGELWKIIGAGVPYKAIRDTSKFEPLFNTDPGVAPFTQGIWEVRAGTFLSGHYLRPGDHLRVSEVSPALLDEIALLARKIRLADDATAVFFQLDSLTARRFPAQLLDQVCNRIR